jgi:SOS response regulatory protein OraA/RecX
MKKVLALISSLLLVATVATPAQSAGAQYFVYQKTLATFSSSATTLTTQQKAQVKATVDANPTAEKFICTGIRYYSQPMSINIMVRKRAMAACDYAKQLNPELSTWFQNKPTQAKSYAGKVLLTVKSLDAPTTIKSPATTESIGQKNAKSKAASYLDYSFFSRSGLIDQLLYEKFSRADAEYAVDAVKANWKLQAAGKAESYLSYSAFSRSGLVDQLLYEGFTSSEAEFGVASTNANWNLQAAKKAKSYLEYSAFSRQGLIDQLKYEGFTQSQAEYGVSKNGY